MSNPSDAILLVEDNAADAELTTMVLARYGFQHQVTHVSDGQQAMDYLYRRNEFADRSGVLPSLVLLDLKMPLLDGIGVLEQIKGSELLRNIPVVVLTSSTEPSDLLKAYNAGTNAYIAKPTDFSQFLASMKHVCEFWLKINQTAPQPSTATARNTGFGDLI